MIRKITLLLLLCVGMTRPSFGQNQCGFDQAHQTLLNTNPAYAQSVSQFNTQLTQWLSNNNNINSLLTTFGADTVYEIPLVIHVMHTGGAVGTSYNPTDGRIDSTIDYLNKVFEANWTGYPAPGSGGTKFPMRFVLAKRTPACSGATNGINRINVPSFTDYNASGYDYAQYGVRRSNPIGQGVRDDSIKRLSIWPNDRYYNIWIVNKIDGVDGLTPGPSFVAGYAYFAGAPANIDGTVMLASQMMPNKITLPHEIGHAFELYHTFEDSDPTIPTCPVNVNCAAQGDLCCDTEPHYLYSPSVCYSGLNNPCTSSNFGDATARNIMNYANCQNRFTPDQRTRVIACLLSTRSSLISSSGSVALPSSALPTVCVPTISNPSASFDCGPRNVKITDANSRTYIDVTSGGYVSDGNVTYRNMTCDHRISLKAGNSYTLSFTSTFSEKGAAYIDYNNDGVLGNATGEKLAIVDQSSGSVHAVTFTVPFSATACTPIRMRVISDNTSGTLDSCNSRVRGQTEDFEVLIFGTNASTASVTVANPPEGGNPSCIGTSLTWRATKSTGTTVIGYQWYINSTPVGGQTADTFKSTVFADKDTVSVHMYYADICGPDTVISNRVVVERRVTIPPAVVIGVTAGSNPTCIDDTVTLSVVGTSNPGGGPTYQWRSNGVDITSATGSSFKAIGRGGEKISVRMVSTAPSPCSDPGFAISNEIEIAYTTKVPLVNIALTIGTNPGCAGQQLQFTASPTTGGTGPTYQWTVNGTPVTGATGVTYNTATLSNNDQVRTIMTSNSPCASPKTVTSASIVVIHDKITADISIAQTTGNNPNCEGKPVIFSANTTNAGKNPTYQWIVNGIIMVGATSPIYVTDSLRNLDRVQCVLIATDPCVLNPLDTSNILTMGIITSKRPKIDVKITAGKNPGCLDSLIEFTADPTDLGTAPDYIWLVNGFQAASGAVFTTSSLLDGNVLILRANQTDGGCYLPDTVYSEPIVLKRSTTPEPAIISLIGNTIYTNFDSSFVWFGPDGTELPDGPAGKAYPSKIGPYWAVTNNNGCWSKPSNILRITLLDISSLDISGLDVYPNPATDKVVLDWKNQRVSYNIDVLNSVGQLVVRTDVQNASRKEISLGNLAAGNYFLLLKDASGKVGVIKIAVDNDK